MHRTPKVGTKWPPSLRNINSHANHIFGAKRQYELVVGQLMGPVGLGAIPLEESLCAVNLVFILPSGQTPALASIHSLLCKAFSDPEVDRGGAHHGGCLDVDGSRQSWRISMCGLGDTSTATFHSMSFTPRALRSFSKFSLVCIFQVMVKLGIGVAVVVVAAAGALRAAQLRLPSVNICYTSE